MSTKTCEYPFKYLSGTSTGIGICGYEYPSPKYPPVEYLGSGDSSPFFSSSSSSSSSAAVAATASTASTAFLARLPRFGGGVIVTHNDDTVAAPALTLAYAHTPTRRPPSLHTRPPSMPTLPPRPPSSLHARLPPPSTRPRPRPHPRTVHTCALKPFAPSMTAPARPQTTRVRALELPVSAPSSRPRPQATHAYALEPPAPRVSSPPAAAAASAASAPVASAPVASVAAAPATAAQPSHDLGVAAVAIRDHGGSPTVSPPLLLPPLLPPDAAHTRAAYCVPTSARAVRVPHLPLFRWHLPALAPPPHALAPCSLAPPPHAPYPLTCTVRAPALAPALAPTKLPTHRPQYHPRP
ncbi:hypothetical protein OF83DRAFT_1176044 [Amylostereum chailletii]|nr:hypothetical protein OF83DRAFT_1176044 [Amylostereum chailletii]